MKKIKTFYELCNIINKGIKNRKGIVIENVEISFKVDFQKLLQECKICKKNADDVPYILNLPVRIYNIFAPEFSFVNIRFNKEVYLGGEDFNIKNIYFCSCQFNSYNRYSVSIEICESLEMIDIQSLSSICLSSFRETKKNSNRCFRML